MFKKFISKISSLPKAFTECFKHSPATTVTPVAPVNQVVSVTRTDGKSCQSMLKSSITVPVSVVSTPIEVDSQAPAITSCQSMLKSSISTPIVFVLKTVPNPSPAVPVVPVVPAVPVSAVPVVSGFISAKSVSSFELCNSSEAVDTTVNSASEEKTIVYQFASNKCGNTYSTSISVPSVEKRIEMFVCEKITLCSFGTFSQENIKELTEKIMNYFTVLFYEKSYRNVLQKTSEEIYALYVVENYLKKLEGHEIPEECCHFTDEEYFVANQYTQKENTINYLLSVINHTIHSVLAVCKTHHAKLVSQNKIFQENNIRIQQQINRSREIQHQEFRAKQIQELHEKHNQEFREKYQTEKYPIQNEKDESPESSIQDESLIQNEKDESPESSIQDESLIQNEKRKIQVEEIRKELVVDSKEDVEKKFEKYQLELTKEKEKREDREKREELAKNLFLENSLHTDLDKLLFLHQIAEEKVKKEKTKVSEKSSYETIEEFSQFLDEIFPREETHYNVSEILTISNTSSPYDDFNLSMKKVIENKDNLTFVNEKIFGNYLWWHNLVLKSHSLFESAPNNFKKDLLHNFNGLISFQNYIRENPLQLEIFKNLDVENCKIALKADIEAFKYVNQEFYSELELCEMIEILVERNPQLISLITNPTKAIYRYAIQKNPESFGMIPDDVKDLEMCKYYYFACEMSKEKKFDDYLIPEPVFNDMIHFITEINMITQL